MKKAKIVIGLILIFFLGFLSGSICTKYFKRRNKHFNKLKPNEMVAKIVKRLTNDLKLNKTQADQTKEIFTQNHKKIGEIRDKISPQIESLKKDTFDRVSLILTSNQQKKFKEIHHRFSKNRPPHR